MKKKTLIAIIAIVSFAMTSCNNGSTGGTTQQPNPVTVTKNVNVTFPAFGTNPTVINLNPIYTPIGGWDSNFSAGDIVSVIKDDLSANDTYWLDKNDINLVRDRHLYGLDWRWPPPIIFTQTFYYKTVSSANKIGEYSFRITDTGGAGYFNHIRNGEGTVPITSLPPTPLTLQLKKTIE